MDPNYCKDGFLFFKQIEGPDKVLKEDRLIVESSRIDETIDYIKNNQIANIHIANLYYKENSLSFFQDLTFIKGVHVLIDKIDLSSINSLYGLEVLRINTSTKQVDFSNLPNLQVLSFDYNKNALNIQACSKLFWLWINGFKEDNLKKIESLLELKYLSLYNAGIHNLKGIESLRELKSIRLDTVRKLLSLDGLSHDLRNLEELDIYGAPALKGYTPLKYITNLKRLELRKTGDMSSVDILEPVDRFYKITLGLKVIDGKMESLKSIPEVGYIDYPHYDIKLKNLKK